MANQDEIIEVMADTLGVPPGDIEPDAPLLQTVGSLQLPDLLHSLSVTFKISFDPSETESLKTVEDLINLVEDKLLE
jgi:acyl carrier protein